MTRAIGIVIVVMACGPAAQPVGPTPIPAPAPAPGPAPGPSPLPAAPSSGLVFGDVQFFLDDIAMMRLHADGSLEVEDKGKTATITADGKVIVAKTGAVLIELLPDGRFMHTPTGAVWGVRLEPDGTVTASGRSLSFDDTGVLVGGSPDHRVKVVGATNPSLRRTAMFVLAALVIPNPKAPTADTGVEVAIAEIRVVHAKTSDPVLTLRADGSVELFGAVKLALTPDGRILDGNGLVIAELLADGRIRNVASGGIWDAAKVLPDGTAERDGKRVSIDRRGNLVGGGLGAPVKITGATSPGLSRTVLFLLLAMAMPEDLPGP